jgi:hypothetical protein
LASPNGGQTFGPGPVNLAWFGSDADGDPLTYAIQYSADGGTNWETLAVDWPGQTYVIDSQFLSATTQGRIRVVASDGFDNSLAAQSAAGFTVLPHSPTVLINTPADDALFSADQQIFLEALAKDPQDGPLDGASVQWTSSLDGPLGNGANLNFEATALSEGDHVITVVATDSFGLTNGDAVQIRVLRQAPPQLSIQLIGNQVLLSWTAAVTDYVLEASASLSPADWIPVSTEPVVMGDQQTVTVDGLSSGMFFRLRRQ